MLRITVPETESWDPVKEEFVNCKEQTLTLEHSLVSIAKWESKWQKPFLDDRTPKTNEEMEDYIRCMTITQNVNPIIYKVMPITVRKEIIEYIKNPMTATWFTDNKKRKAKEIITAEVIYYWMIAMNIPVEFEKWHLNRLLALIQVCNEKSNPKKMSRGEIYSQNKAINEARKRALHTKG